MSVHPKLDAALSIVDRAILWVLVCVCAWTLRELALRADRDPPSLISPVCVSTASAPLKGTAK